MAPLCWNLLLSLTAFCVTTASGYTSTGMVSVQGRKFSLAFFLDSTAHKDTIRNTLFMSSLEPGSCTINYYGGGYRTTYLTPGQIVSTEVPNDKQVTIVGTGVEAAKAIYVSCDVDVLLHAYDRLPESHGVDTESYVVLPDSLLSNYYMVPGVQNSAFIAVVPLFPKTQVSLHVRTNCAYTYGQRTIHSGDVVNVTLNLGNVFRFGAEKAGGDHCELSGSEVFSNRPVSAFYGSLQDTHYLALATQLVPMSGRTKTVIVPYSAERYYYPHWRVLATEDDTHINFTREFTDGGVGRSSIVLNKGQYNSGPGSVNNLIVQSDKPIFVSRIYAFKTTSGSLQYYPDISQYENKAVLVRNFYEGTVTPVVTVVTETKSVNDLRVNGQIPDNITWVNMYTLPYSVGTFKIQSNITYSINSSSPLLVRLEEHQSVRYASTYLAGYKITPPHITTGEISSVVQLKCEESRLEIVIDSDKLPLTDLYNLYLTTPSCHGSMTGPKLIFTTSYKDCEPKMKEINGSVTYTYLLTYAPPAPRVSWHHTIQCSIPATDSGSVHIAAGQNTLELGQTTGTYSHSSVHVSLFRDKDFRREVTDPVVNVDIGEHVYAQVMTRNPNTVMVVKSCHANLDTRPVRVALIEDGCAVNSKVKVLQRRDQVTRFTFDLALPAYDSERVTVTCQVTFCDPMDFSDKCTVGCKTAPQGSIIGK